MAASASQTRRDNRVSQRCGRWRELSTRIDPVAGRSGCHEVEEMTVQRCPEVSEGRQCILEAGHTSQHRADWGSADPVPVMSAEPASVVPVMSSAPPVVVPAPAVKPKRRPLLGFLILAVLIAGGVLYSAVRDKAVTTTTSGAASTADSSAVGVPITYDELFRNADAVRGREVSLYGKIGQVIPDGSGFQFLLQVEPDQYGLALNHDVFLYDYTGPRLLEGDVVDVVGAASGVQEYKTVLGATRQVPSVRVDRISRSARAWPSF